MEVHRKSPADPGFGHLLCSSQQGVDPGYVIPAAITAGAPGRSRRSRRRRWGRRPQVQLSSARRVPLAHHLHSSRPTPGVPVRGRARRPGEPLRLRQQEELEDRRERGLCQIL